MSGERVEKSSEPKMGVEGVERRAMKEDEW